MLPNVDIVDIGKSDGICSFTSVVDEFQDYFYIHQSYLLNIQNLHK